VVSEPASLGTAAAVAISGLIGFVGLVVPHGVRMLSGPSARRLIPLSAIYGAVLLSAADLVAIRDAAACGVENVAEIALRPELERAARSQARSFLSTAACGICGKTAIESIFAKGIPLLDVGRPRLARSVLESLPARMREAQRGFAKTGGVLLSGDLYHYPAERTLHRLPTFEVSEAQTEKSRATIEAFLAQSKAQLWIQHDLVHHRTLKKSPDFYD